MERRLTYEIKKATTIQNFLKQELKFTKRQISSLKFQKEGILVGGVRRRVDYLLTPGEQLSLQMEEALREEKILPLYEPFKILYEDEELLAVDKPPGILVHPVGGHYGDTLSNRVSAYLKEKGEAAVIRPVGRLDKDTSGIVLFAKNKIAAARLSGDKEKGGYQKEYLALVHGILKEKTGEITVPIGRAPGTALRMQVDFEKGKAAKTSYEVLETFPSASLVKLAIATGRTHQIRVHMAYLGHPLWGDRLYGSAAFGGNDGFSRTTLHAYRVTFLHPFTGEKKELTAPVPEDFLSFPGLLKSGENQEDFTGKGGNL